MTDPSDVLAKLAKLVAYQAPLRPLIYRLCEACRLLLGADSAAITFGNSIPERITVAATDELAELLEDLQDVLGEGPGLDAYLSAAPVVSLLDEGADQKWPLLASALVRRPPVRVYAMPMRPSSTPVGVLTLIRADGGTLTETVETAQFLSDAVGAALLRDPPPQVDPEDSNPWFSRAQIHQATGIVCAQLHIGPDDALAILKAHAFAHGAHLHRIAELVMSRHLDFTTDG